MAGAELIGKEEMKEVMDVMETGVLMRYGFDKERKGIFKVRQFEEEFAKYCGVRYALGVTSGSSALKVALTAMDICPGDEVIVPAFTFLASYEAVLEVGAIPVMADIDATLNIDPASIEKRITPRTKAIMPVHMCGSGAHIDQIMELAKVYHLMVLEDNAQGCGGSYRSKKLGNFGDMGIFSFDYYKTLTTGEGGMVVTDNKHLYDRAEWYHDHGHDHNPKVSRAMEGRTILGFNYRMNELQGALGLAQLRKLDWLIAEQKKNKQVIKRMLSSVPGIKFRELPIRKAIRQPSWLLTCPIKPRRQGSRRLSAKTASIRSALRIIPGTMCPTGSISRPGPRQTPSASPLPIRCTGARSITAAI